MKVYKNYLLRVLISIDQTLNVILLNGSEDETISGRVGWKSITTKKWYWRVAHWFIDTLFWLDDDHCVSSIEKDEYRKYPLFRYNVITWLLIIWVIYEQTS
jgi:hypothetical protein